MKPLRSLTRGRVARTRGVIALLAGLLGSTGPTAFAAETKRPKSSDAPATQAAVTPDQAISALRSATRQMRSLATEGGYVYLYTPDNPTRRTAERPASMTQIAIQAPGTPSMGLAFLRAYAATGDTIHLDAARAAARALARCQLASGGWDRVADFNPARPNVDGKRYDADNRKLTHVQILQHTIYTTFDDDTTQSAVRFLLTLVERQKDSQEPDDLSARQTLEKAVAGMLRAQYPNGAWPQRFGGEARDPKDFPVRPAHVEADYPRTYADADYTRYYTLNDNCQTECIEAMLLAYRVLGREELLQSARRGADFFLLAQLPDPQPAWAQQYGFDMQPAWARRHEMPSVSSMESSNVVRALLEIYLQGGQEQYLKAAGRAVDWLERSQIRPGQWARLYELGTNKPVYGDDRGTIFYRVKDLEGKYQTSYGWESAFKIPAALALYKEVVRLGRDGYLAAKAAERPDPKAVESNARRAVESLDEKGRWIVNDRWQKGRPPEPFISTKAFIANVEALATYLEAK